MKERCFTVKEVNDLKAVAEQLLDCYPNDRIFAFYGEMGVGKTTFIKAICKLLGIIDTVNSPTFAIINEYHTKDRTPVFHFDFYRLQNLKEVFDLGYEDYFYSGYYCFLEWTEKIEDLLPEHFLKINVSINDDKSRTIVVKPN